MQNITLLVFLWFPLFSWAIDINDVQSQVFTPTCATAGCHNGSIFPNLQVGSSFNSIVGVDSRQSALKLVQPFDPDNSYIVKKIEGTGVGSRMPIGQVLPESLQQLVHDWVDQGALENDTLVATDSDGGSDNDTSFGTAFLQTTSTSNNISYTHLINTSSISQTFVGTLFNGDGVQLGPSNQPLHDGSVAPNGRIILASEDLEHLFSVPPWVGPAMLEVQGTDTFKIMTKLTSPSGLISNTNCVTTEQVHNIDGFDQSDMTYVRFINTTDSTMFDIKGSLFDTSGAAIGSSNQVLVESLPPKGQVWRNRNQLSDTVGDTWNGSAGLRLSSPPDGLKLLNLNFVNSETFFNFSCYQAGT